MSETTVVFAGTFDPVTNGHLDLVRRARRLFGRVVICVSSAAEGTLLSAEERVSLFRESLGDVEDVTIEVFDGLIVERARHHGASALIRGIRGFQDWDFEMQMAFANRGLEPDLDTVFLPPSPGMADISSSLVREVATLGGDVSGWVPEPVVRALEVRLARDRD